MITSPETRKPSKNEVFNPIRPDYADFEIDIRDSFDWLGIIEQLNIPIGKKVVVFTFRGVEREDVESEVLAAFDERALIAAEGAKGFIHYQPNDGLSYCIWETQEDAQVATSSPEHRAAAMYAPRAYKKWELTCWDVTMPIQGEIEFVRLWTHSSD